jgi:hypothetical protein
LGVFERRDGDPAHAGRGQLRVVLGVITNGNVITVRPQDAA